MAKIEKCSCDESEFLRVALASIHTLCTDDTPVDAARVGVVEVASEALGDPQPGGEPFCSCGEALHLRRALRACFNVCQDEGQSAGAGGPCDDLAQCNNFAAQGRRLQAITGDPGVYDAHSYIPALHETDRLYLGAARQLAVYTGFIGRSPGYSPSRSSMGARARASWLLLSVLPGAFRESDCLRRAGWRLFHPVVARTP
jgi:hypothetical protein